MSSHCGHGGRRVAQTHSAGAVLFCAQRPPRSIANARVRPNALQTEAMTAYNRKQLRKAEQLFGKIMQLDTENVAVWYERRGQVSCGCRCAPCKSETGRWGGGGGGGWCLCSRLLAVGEGDSKGTDGGKPGCRCENELEIGLR